MSVANNLSHLQKKIANAALQAGRGDVRVELVAVSKQQPDEKIREALSAGVRVFGENRVQEAQARWGALKGQYPDLKIHLVGPLQTNKVKEAVALFDVIETLDREKLADSLAAEMQKQGRNLPCFIQVNTGAEPQKSGVLPGELKALLSYARGLGIDVQGLMCIPPLDEPPELHFALLNKLAKENGLEFLSMGMSGDFEEAVKLGATHVRVGTALFGEREV